jgi:hypothetical protein
MLLRLFTFALCCALLAACGVPAATIAPSPTPSLPPSPTPLLPPSPTPPLSPSPTLPLPSPTPSNEPLRVGLQVGHWKIEEHPEEQRRLRKFSGAYYRGYDEWELNIVIAEQTRDLLVAQGVAVDLVPAVVPVGYSADAFVSIHVDGVTGGDAATRRGWKVATPFRASAASDALAAAIAETYPAVTGLPSDPQGPSYDMRAYYAFASYRYWHSIAPTTPAVIVETAFMTHPADRELLFDRPELIAEGIAAGVLRYLDGYDRADEAARVPSGGPLLRPSSPGVELRDDASARSAVQRVLAPGEELVPMARAGDWVLVFTRGGDWDLGWVRADSVTPVDAPVEPPFPCCGE